MTTTTDKIADPKTYLPSEVTDELRLTIKARNERDELRRDRDNYRTQCNLARKERAEAIASRDSARDAAQSHFDAYKAQGEHLRTLRADLARANESATLYLDTFRSESAINRELRAQIVTLDALLNPNPSNPMKPKIGA